MEPFVAVFVLFALLFSLGCTVFWIWTIVDAAKTPDQAWVVAGQSKILWIVLIAVLGPSPPWSTCCGHAPLSGGQPLPATGPSPTCRPRSELSPRIPLADKPRLNCFPVGRKDRAVDTHL